MGGLERINRRYALGVIRGLKGKFEERKGEASVRYHSQFKNLYIIIIIIIIIQTVGS